MIIKKLHTPEGVKDYLPSECILKTKIENNVSKVFKSFGYVPVKFLIIRVVFQTKIFIDLWIEMVQF